MRKRPLLLWACVFVLGLLDGHFMAEGFTVFAVTTRIAAAVIACHAVVPYLVQHNYKRLVIRLCSLTLIFICGCIHMQSQIQFRERELEQIREGADISLCGEIYKKEYRKEQLRVYLKNCYAVSKQSEVACNQVILYLQSDEYPIGEILLVNGKVNMFSSATNEGGFDERNFYFSQKIDFAMKAPKVRSAVTGKEQAFFSPGRKSKSPEPAEDVLLSKGLWQLQKKMQLQERLWKLRQKISSVFGQIAAPDASGVLAVMLVGDKNRLDTGVQKLYQNAGISHILAISGLHVSLVGMGLYRFFRRRGLKYGAAFSGAFVMVLFYAIMSGNGVSTQRAVGMMLLCMLADVLGKGYDLLNALGGIVLLLLWENPFLIWYSGFQFSVTAILVIGTAGVCIPVEPAGSSGRIRGLRCINKLYGAFAVWLGTLPLVAFYYYEIPVYAAFLNMLVLPLMPILFLCGLTGGLVGCVNLPVARILLTPCAVILQIYEKLAEAFLHFPKANVIVGKPDILQIFLFYGFFLAIAAIWKRKRTSHGLRIIGMAVLFLVLLYPQKQPQEIVVLDVGQGDGTFLRTKEKLAVFVDGGSSNIKGVGTYRILPFLKAKGVRKIDYWMVSHGDSDHISGLLEVLESGYRVEHLIVSEWAFLNEAETENMQKLLELANQADTPVLTVAAGDLLQMEKTRISFLWPQRESEGTSDTNDNSLVFLYADEDFRGIFAGDISSETEKALIKTYVEYDGGDAGRENLWGQMMQGAGEENVEQVIQSEDECVEQESAVTECQKYRENLLDVDFYKVNHHGSKYSSCEEWLAALSPKVATISCSRKNSYGHPHEETLKRLHEAETIVYRTDEVGAITIHLERAGQVAEKDEKGLNIKMQIRLKL